MKKQSKKLYSLRKSRHLLKTCYAWYKKKGGTFDKEMRASLEEDLEQLDQAVLRHDRETASTLARKVEALYDDHGKKSFWDYTSEIAIAIILALMIATVVRQVWFEQYEIPSGSMRPTFREQDHLAVTKTAFGINVPLQAAHFYFDPDLVQRTSVLIFSGHHINLADTDANYFGIIPYKKQYIKRLIGKPGDTVYFYGGKIYGIDREGNPLPELLNNPSMQAIDHIPFLSFDGEVSSTNNQIFFSHFGNLLGRISSSPFGNLRGEILVEQEWKKDDPLSQLAPHETVNSYSDFYGIHNFAMARLLTKEELEKYTDFSAEEVGEGVLYLELRHTPSLVYPSPEHLMRGSQQSVMLSPQKTVIPLQQEHLDRLMDNMYTTRFDVAKGRAKANSQTGFSTRSPELAGVPDGTYEFYFGKPVKVGWGGVLSDLPEDHLLAKRTPENTQKLYNLGIEWYTAFAPHSQNQLYFPHRYAYFRDGDLYLLGAPVIKKDDPILTAFHKKEAERQENSSSASSYTPFRDWGPPIKDGEFDAAFIREFGLRVPDKHYLVLGDNHAVSSDSRVFGFVPENNIQGAPSFIFWPPGDRWGPPVQKSYPTLTLPRLIIWGIALLIVMVWYMIHRNNLKKPIFKKINF